MSIRLTRVEGPGHFLVWQSTGFGSFDVKMDSRDGIDPNDRLTPFVGGHEHHNGGFTTNGQTYCTLTYTRVKAATDCDYEVVVASDLLSSDWQPLTVIHGVVDRGADELVTVRDQLPVPLKPQRCYRLQVKRR